MSNLPERRIGAVILAAGGSRRLGRPKQLVIHKGRSLLHRTINSAIDAGVGTIVVVLGGSAGEIRDSLPQLPPHVHFVVNAHWEDGMGTSIAVGVQMLRSLEPETSGSLILVCDQPALDTEIVAEFLRRGAAEPRSIVLADYGGSRGPPVLFPSRYFDELGKLRGDEGARDIHRRHADEVTTVSFPGGLLDIDTPEDLCRVRD